MSAARSRRAKVKPLTQREITKAIEQHWERGHGDGTAKPKQRKQGTAAGKTVRSTKKSKPSK